MSNEGRASLAPRLLVRGRHEAMRLAIDSSTYVTNGTMGELLELAHLIHEWIENGTWQ